MPKRGSTLDFFPPLPFSRVYRLHENFTLLGSGGIFVRSGGTERPPSRYDPSSFTFIAWPNLRIRIDGPRLTLTGVKTTLPSPGFARSMADRLLRLQALDGTEREATVRKHGLAAFDPATAKGRLSAFDETVLPLQRLSTLLALLLFAGVFLVAFSEPHPSVLLFGLGTFVALYFALLVILGRTRRRLQAEGLVEARGVLAGAIMSPPGSPMGCVQLGRDLLRDLDELAVTSVLDKGTTLRSKLASELFGIDLALQAVVQDETTEQVQESWNQIWELRRVGVEDLAAACEVNLESLHNPPVATDPQSTSYCRLCRGDFREVPACPDCLLPLTDFSDR